MRFRYKILKPKLWIMLSISVLISIRSYSQSPYIIDSLKTICTTGKTDSARITAFTELAYVYGSLDLPMSLKYCESALKIAMKVKNNKTRLLGYVKCQFAHVYNVANDSIHWKKSIQEAEQLAEDSNDPILIGLISHERAMRLYARVLDYQGALKQFLKSIDLLQKSNYHRTLLLNYSQAGVIFQKLHDYNKNLYYSEKSLAYAKTPNDVVLSYHYIGIAYANIGFKTIGNETKIDSGMLYLKRARQLMHIHKKRIKDLFLLAEITNLIAKGYVNDNCPYIYNMDSAFYYLEESRKEALESGNRLMYTSACTILSKYYLDANNIKRAEYLLDEATRSYFNKNDKYKIESYLIKSEIYLGLTFLKEKQKNFKEAIDNLKLYYATKDTIYNTQKLSAIRNIEAKFNIAKKEGELVLLQKRGINQRRSIYFYILVSLVGIVLCVFLFRTYLFAKKFFQARQLVLQQQAVITRLKKDELEHKLKMQLEESRRLTLEHEVMTSQREHYQRELMTSVLHLEKKNELLLKLKKSLVPLGDHVSDYVTTLQKILDSHLEEDNDFEYFSRNFELVYPDFFKRLNDKAADNLTQLDLRYCAYIHMGLSTKEMSNLLNIDPASIRTARYRLKQKFNLSKDEDLSDFINKR